MSKITLIGIDTAKHVFHLVGIDERGNYAYRKKLRRQRLLPTLAQLESCRVVMEACAASHHWAAHQQDLVDLRLRRSGVLPLDHPGSG